MTRSEFRRAYSPKPAPAPQVDYMVCAWRQDNRYDRADAILIYRSERIAQRKADHHNRRGEFGGNLVVRSIARVSLAGVEG